MDDADRQLLNEMNRTMGRVEGTVNGISSRQDRMDRYYGEKQKSNDERIGSLEDDRAQAKGRATAFGMVGGGVMSFIGFIIYELMK